MAHNDLEELFKFRKRTETSYRILTKIIDMTRTEMTKFEDRDDMLYLSAVLSVADTQGRAITDQIITLERYALCEHVEDVLPAPPYSGPVNIYCKYCNKWLGDKIIGSPVK